MLDIPAGVSSLHVYVYGKNELIFKNTEPDIQFVYFDGDSTLTVTEDFLIGLNNLRLILMSGMAINGFPMFNSTSLTDVDISDLKLPSLITIDSSMLNLPQLTFLRPTSNIEWYKFAVMHLKTR
ncbi:hypothetical protein LOD99_7397 [Oopsacas minuta]|uniref:Uncharacterized protein n=1 Tax=Oopsacas minuta TaxID=111878 RepID=A0AAV7JTX4_9METZ|nr:hypothetical protein LOD99_7397 [Oopsacas minuta]